MALQPSTQSCRVICVRDGSAVAGFPFISSYNGSTPGTLADLNGDNNVKLITGHSNGVMMLNLRRPASGLAPWITYRGSALRQGSFASTGSVAGVDAVQTPAASILYQNYPNPFMQDTNIDYSIAKDAPVQVEIYNLKGQKIRSWNLPHQSKGMHSLHWDGTDSKGNTVSSGIYLYRMESAGSSQTHRMLRLK